MILTCWIKEEKRKTKRIKKVRCIYGLYSGNLVGKNERFSVIRYDRRSSHLLTDGCHYHCHCHRRRRCGVVNRFQESKESNYFQVEMKGLSTNHNLGAASLARFPSTPDMLASVASLDL